MNEERVIAAVAHLNEQLRTLPESIDCTLEGMYPEFDYPDHSPQVYLALVEELIIEGGIDKPEAADRLMNMLIQCAIALRQTGV